MANMKFILALACIIFNSQAEKFQIQNGDSLSIPPGVSIQVSLESNPSTGFNWVIENFPSNAFSVEDYGYEEVIQNQFILDAGLPQNQIFKITALNSCVVEKDTASVTFAYYQPWMPPDPNAKRITIKLFCALELFYSVNKS